jgi:coenzyme PQQ precursor peptide PqqA
MRALKRRKTQASRVFGGARAPSARPGSYFGAVDARSRWIIFRRRAAAPTWAKRLIRQEENMTESLTWTTPQACEICVGMEVTAYMSAEI